ncbi:superinfection immunity protein [Actinomadura xylanilytica]|uniref:superinfection immunity protein n=1 Tax=Actinomadura xylanilytica TaxID=887459 RepID=UPI00255AFE31|nr:superinfection immunity protein [Actinomadura xylanilytica]MDL4770713.1 superinfection immunity protein [Actinomadura xylanilytica]
METITSTPYFPLLLVGALVGIAVLPTFIAIVRGVDEIMLIILFNVLACATVLGWPIALVMAIKWPRRRDYETPPPRHPRPPRIQSTPPHEYWWTQERQQ